MIIEYTEATQPYMVRSHGHVSQCNHITQLMQAVTAFRHAVPPAIWYNLTTKKWTAKYDMNH